MTIELTANVQQPLSIIHINEANITLNGWTHTIVLKLIFRGNQQKFNNLIW